MQFFPDDFQMGWELLEERRSVKGEVWLRYQTHMQLCISI